MRFFKKKDEVLDPYTVEKCTGCNKISERKFVEGDYVFKTTGKCTACGAGQMMIDKIFGEIAK
jgi:hypothetical protein